jgi:hypothetical protein
LVSVIASLGRGSLTLKPSKILSGILEAKSLADMQNAEGRITIQVLTILTLTSVQTCLPLDRLIAFLTDSVQTPSRREFFTGALTNGPLWRFFVAYAGENQLQIYSSAELAMDTDQGLIIELLKDMVSSNHMWSSSSFLR